MYVFSEDCKTVLKDKLKGLRIAVIGDVMLDQYYNGEVTRISPEAPVPINHIQSIRSVLGGASNVASNLSNLGCCVFLGSVCGRDANSERLFELLKEQQINCIGLFKSLHRPTISKIRVLGMGQQMLRLDFEEICDLYEEEVSALQKWFLSLLEDGIDGVLISDYAKGVCSPQFCNWIINKANEYHIPVLVDPKGKNWAKYKGCDFITPNVKEVSDILGCTVHNKDDEILTASCQIKEQYGFKNLVVTRSEKGITMVGNKAIHSPAISAEVFDVTGCGDTVAAVLLAAFICGLSDEEMLALANCAAGVVIRKVGTYPIHYDELIREIQG